jgi:hypothetical protein
MLPRTSELDFLQIGPNLLHYDKFRRLRQLLQKLQNAPVLIIGANFPASSTFQKCFAQSKGYLIW